MAQKVDPAEEIDPIDKIDQKISGKISFPFHPTFGNI